MLRDVRDLTAVLGALVYDDIARPYCVYFLFLFRTRPSRLRERPKVNYQHALRQTCVAQGTRMLWGPLGTSTLHPSPAGLLVCRPGSCP